MQAMRNDTKDAALSAVPEKPITPPQVQKRSSSWTHLVAGAAGGMATALLTSPLDVLRTRLQSDFYRSQLKSTQALQHSRPSVARSFILHFSETFEILFSIHRVEGWRSLFRGLGPSLTGVVPATAIKFYAYGNCKRLYPDLLGIDKDATSVHALSAASAGVVTGTATNPIWLVKTRLQLDKSHVNSDGSIRPPQYRNSLDCVKQVLQQEGIKGLYRGLMASYLGVIETTLHLAAYERIKVMVARHNERKGKAQSSEATQALFLSSAAGVSKLLAVLIAYPHEVIRTRLRQAPMADGRQKYTGVIQCLRLMVKEEGLVSLYGGLTAHMIRTVPSAAITLGTYELVLKLLSGHPSS
ncbi:putative mitochondrial carrier protein (Rim2) [Aspergillus lucknowensis]|uniref:Mitochondrial carrier domain-containing protein n=1 Tax=Aspergillus lucknowensis TaxID=176173 RepID=A0ABR4LW70_9EURO